MQSKQKKFVHLDWNNYFNYNCYNNYINTYIE